MRYWKRNKESTIKLRDENIRMSEERGRELPESGGGIDLGLSPSEIRKKLRREKQNDSGKE